MPDEAWLTNEEPVPVGGYEAGADLLQRSFDQVEQLLRRLEVSGPTEPVSSDAPPRSYEADVQPHVDGNGHRGGAEVPVESTVEAEALRIKLTAHDEANRILAEARERAAQQSAEAEARARERLDAAERDAEQIRRTAREMAEAETARRIDAHVHTAVESARSDAEARSRAHDTLSVAGQNLAIAAEGLETLIEALKSGLTTLAVTTDVLHSMLGATNEPPSTTTEPVCSERLDEFERAPLGNGHVGAEPDKARRALAGLLRGGRQ